MSPSYSDTLHYLYEKLPMFQRIGSAAIKKDLSNTLALCNLLGNPQDTFKSIHIAGTNGKGSTAHMLAAALQQSGYKTGLYTSPHLKDFRERIRINGEMLSEKEVITFVERTRDWIEDMQPSFFEVTVAMAFDHFARHEVDIAVIETGLGGRLDSTNIITPILSIITNISFDHQHLLGHTLQEIAHEKAGIIKPCVPVVIGRKQEEISLVFLQVAKEMQAEIVHAEDIPMDNIKIDTHLFCADFRLNQLGKIEACTDLNAVYQEENLRTTICALHTLSTYNLLPIDLPKALEGIANTQTLTGLRGRWQVISKKPLTIADGAHNPDGIKQMLRQVKLLRPQILYIILGMVKDKDIQSVLTLLPKKAVYFFTQPNLPRALPAAELKQLAQQFGLQGNAYKSSKQALTSAQRSAAENSLVLVTGSLFLVGELV